MDTTVTCTKCDLTYHPAIAEDGIQGLILCPRCGSHQYRDGRGLPIETDDPSSDGASQDAMIPLSKDLLSIIHTMDRSQARQLVDTYYRMQDNRKRSTNQVTALAKREGATEIVAWLSNNEVWLEKQIKRALSFWANQHVESKWAQSIPGIGPVISAGLLAYLSPDIPETVGHWWRFAGLDPTREWLGQKDWRDRVAETLPGHRGKLDIGQVTTLCETYGHHADYVYRMLKLDEPQPITAEQFTAAMARRPWNAKLKVLCWKMGESFVKVSGRPNDIYGQVYLARKAYEQRKNEAGDYAGQAEAVLSKYKNDTVARTWYQQGKLPPGHIHARCQRYAVKLFLSHYHHVCYMVANNGKLPPKPYVLEHLGHVDYIQPPNLDVIGY